MLIIPSFILAIEDESDRDLMEQVYRQYHRLMYHIIYQLTDDPFQLARLTAPQINQLLKSTFISYSRWLVPFG